MKRKKSLKRMTVFFMTTCWALPIVVLFIFIHTSYKSAYLDRTESLIQESVKNSAVLLSSRIEEAISLFQKPSYELKWENAWLAYQAERIETSNYFLIVKDSLKVQFYGDDRFSAYAFYSDELKNPVLYSSRYGYTYKNYMESVQPMIEQIMQKDSNYTEVHMIDNQVFLIRNLYTVSGYKRYGTFVVALNPDKLFEGFPMEQPENVVIGVNGTKELAFLVPGEKTKEEMEMYQMMWDRFAPTTVGTLSKISGKIYNGFSFQEKLDNFSLGFYYIVSHSHLRESLYELYRVVYAMILILIPILTYAIYFFKKQIEIPLGKLVDASGLIRDGKIGTVIAEREMPNQEFDFLVESFNNMSGQVKYLFDTVYNEKLARKDAQISALQAQINPHFLNNTLEMMNWQARMNNDIETSNMIEALGIVLDHSINRANEQKMYLSEELRCADAYLYIMSMRFGKRLKIERKIDENLLRTLVPQLILQPLIENAIVHGIETVKQGTISLEIHHDEQHIYLDVINTGRPIPQEQLKRIQEIMAGVQNPESMEKGKHTSIGIRNVNKRIKLVYGEEYGLSITSMEDGRTLSRIVVPFCEDAQM